MTSLHGLIRVQRVEPPPMSLFVICPSMVKRGEDGVLEGTLDIEAYVLMSALSPELRTLVKRELTEKSIPREELIKQLHPDTQREYAEMAARREDMEHDAKVAKETEDEEVDYSLRDSDGDPVAKAIAIIEEHLGEPIPDYVKYAPEALADVVAIHGVDELKSIAETMKKEIEYHRLVHDQGVDPEEASLRVFGPPPGP